MRFQQAKCASWLIEKMADGSIAMLDQRSSKSYFLNVTAAAAWEAAKHCGVEEIAGSMSQALHAPVSPEVALAALTSLEEKGLVESGDAALNDRRSALKRLGIAAGIAGPVVLALAASEQKALAVPARSGFLNP